MKFHKEHFPTVSPLKLIGKIPMEQIVIDSNGNLFKYSFTGKSLKYLWIGQALMDNKT